MEFIAHSRSHKYIQKVKTKSGKWRYIYSRPHGRSRSSEDAAFDEYQKWEAQDLAKRDQARKANTSSNYNDINWSETRNGYTYTHGDKALREMYPWRYKMYSVPADSHNAENSRNRKIASQVSTEGRRKEQMAERKFYKKTEVADKALAKLRSFGILGQIVEPFVKKWAKMKVSSLIGKQKS